MKGRAFLDLARDLARGVTEAHWRGAAVHAYYALMLECRDVQARWGLPLPPRHNVHAQVRLRFVYSKNLDLQHIGGALDDLVRLRNLASYDLSQSSTFASANAVQQAVNEADGAITVLDQIDHDPARRAAAIASLPP